MNRHLMPYPANEIQILRTTNPFPRPCGDGEESATTSPISESFLRQPLCNVPTLTSREEELTVSHESTSLFKAGIPCSSQTDERRIPNIKSVAERLTKVSLFSSPDSVMLSSIPDDFLSREKIILRPVALHRLNSAKPKEFPMRRKEPKFVPYEPYKGCVNPITKSGPSKLKIKEILATESQPKLENQDEKNPPLLGEREAHLQHDKIPVIIADFERERSKWEKQNSTLTKENESLKSQLEQMRQEISSMNQHLSTQSQVNKELKKLLVASIGEDVQGRVQCLTEDKARMATMIRKYSEKVDKDFEEKERMSIQCDVWRSKFLASSLLLDELAQWKGILFQRLEEAKEAIRLLLKERDVVHPYLVNVYKMAFQVQEAFDPLHAESIGIGSLESCDIVSLSSASSSLTENVRDRLLGTLGRSVGCLDLKLPDETSTPGEKIALQVLEECLELCSKKMSLNFNPVQRSAVACRFHPNTRYEHLTMNCCKHCNGEIKVI